MKKNMVVEWGLSRSGRVNVAGSICSGQGAKGRNWGMPAVGGGDWFETYGGHHTILSS